MKGNISDDSYYHFLLLHSGIRLLSNERSRNKDTVVAQKILEDFVTFFGNLYGDEQVSFNIHGLLHLSDSVKKLGPLDSYSAYRFENYMQFLKKNY